MAILASWKQLGKHSISLKYINGKELIISKRTFRREFESIVLSSYEKIEEKYLKSDEEKFEVETGSGSNIETWFYII